jgi:hypothetical protein
MVYDKTAGIHPDDQPGFRELIQTAIGEKAEWEAQQKLNLFQFGASAWHSLVRHFQSREVCAI